MNIFLSYGHDTNTPLIEKIKEYLSKDEEGNPRHKVWMDTSDIIEGQDWRRRITDGVIQSDVVLAGLSQHSTRSDVCRGELSISIGVKGGNIKTILLEPSDVVAPPAMISHIQWLDMSDWKEHEKEGFDSYYFQEKFRKIAEIIETPENEQFDGEITTLKAALEPISSISRIKALTKREMCGRRWLYEKIEEWDRISNERLFWIVAGPGFGKSMFAANLQEQYNDRIPAIQFVEWGKPDHSNPCRILKNLAFQLAVRYPEYRKFVLQLPDVINQKMNEKNEDELFDLLFCESTWMKIDGGQENVWVLIDALDEANDEHGNRIAQTLGRHMDRMPQWIRFILTSRDDSKVRLPLQKYHPQIFDLEEYVKEKNSEDLLLYVRRELKPFHPTEEQVKQIVDKSQGVFLYLSLCVEEIHKGEYSLDNLERLPDGLNGYYYEFFNRQFGNDLEKYKKEIAPVLQLMVAAKKNLQLPFLWYLLGLSDTNLYKVVMQLEHICRVTEENGNEFISFFHNSVENWLSDHKCSGLFYISKEDGHKVFAYKYLEWLRGTLSEKESFWSYYNYGLYHLQESGYVWPARVENAIVNSKLASMHGNTGFGSLTRTHNEARGDAYYYCKSLLDSKTDDGTFEFLGFVVDLFEATLDGFIMTDIVSKETRSYKSDHKCPLQPSSTIHDAIAHTSSIGGLFRLMYDYPLTDLQLGVIIIILDILSFYDYILGRDVRWCSLSDMGGFTSRELMDISTAYRSKVNRRMNIEDPAALFISFRTCRYPEHYPDNGIHQYKVLGYIYECMHKKEESIALNRRFIELIFSNENTVENQALIANAYEAIARQLSSSDDTTKERQGVDALIKAEKIYEIICRKSPMYYGVLSTVQNNLGIQYESLGDRPQAKVYLEKAIQSSLLVNNKTEDDISGLATYYVNLGILLSDDNDLEHSYEKFEECMKYRMQLAKINPENYLQPLGMILLRMSGLACRMHHEYDAELCRRKALFVYKLTDLKSIQYAEAIQQLDDNISKLKESRKSFWGISFNINQKRMEAEYNEFIECLKTELK